MTRPRLLSRLDARAPLTVLRAPVGFGKTTLIAQWLAGEGPAGETVAWLRQRPGTDPDDFWTALADALHNAALPPPTAGRQRSPHALVEQMVTATDRPLLIVLDGFENVPDTDVDAALVDLLWQASHLRLIVGQRSHKHFAADRFLDLEPMTIGARELLFTAEETAQLFSDVGLDLPSDQIAAIHEESGGWPEPTKAFALTLKRSGSARDLPQAAGAIALNYLRQRLIPATNRPDRVEFALATSVPDELTVEVAQLLTTEPSAKAELDWLVAEGVLLSDVKDGRPVYRWPGAARRALAAELHRRHPDRVPELHARLAGWYLEAGRPGRALRHATRAESWALVVTIIDASWRQLILNHRDALYDALVATPIDAIAVSPRAVAMRDLWLRMPDDRLLTAARLPSAPAELADLGRSDQVREVVDTGLAVLIALRRRGRFDLARDHASQLLEIARAARINRPADVVQLLPGVQLAAGQTRLLADDIDGAFAPLQRAYERAADSPFDYVQADAAASLALVHAVTGSPESAMQWLVRHDQAPRPTTWLAAQVQGKAAAARVLVALDHLDLDRAAAAIPDVPDHLGTSEFWSYFTYVRLLYALHKSAQLDGLDLLDRARTLHRDWLDHGATAGPLLAAAEADLFIALGRGNKAHAVLHGRYAGHPLLRVSHARLALLSGHPADALRIATDSTWAGRASARHRMGMLLIQTMAAHRIGDERAAAAGLRRAVDIADNAGSLRAFTAVPRDELRSLAVHVPAALHLLDSPPLVTAPDLFPAHITLIRLTERERQVLNKLAEGLTGQQIADALVVSFNTVKTQLRSLYQKLGATSRADALSRARQQGLVDEEV